jgi:hypothetical protein
MKNLFLDYPVNIWETILNLQKSKNKHIKKRKKIEEPVKGSSIVCVGLTILIIFYNHRGRYF